MTYNRKKFEGIVARADQLGAALRDLSPKRSAALLALRAAQNERERIGRAHAGHGAAIATWAISQEEFAKHCREERRPHNERALAEREGVAIAEFERLDREHAALEVRWRSAAALADRCRAFLRDRGIDITPEGQLRAGGGTHA